MHQELYDFLVAHELCDPPVELHHNLDGLAREVEETGIVPDGYEVTVMCAACGLRLQRTVTTELVQQRLSDLAARHDLTVEQLVQLSERPDGEAAVDQIVLPDVIAEYLRAQRNIKPQG